MSDSLLDTTAEVIDALGGTRAVADLTGSKYTAAFNWRSMSAFPPKTYVVMTRALAVAGRSASPRLWGMVGGLEEGAA